MPAAPIITSLYYTSFATFVNDSLDLGLLYIKVIDIRFKLLLIKNNVYKNSVIWAIVPLEKAYTLRIYGKKELCAKNMLRIITGWNRDIAKNN